MKYNAKRTVVDGKQELLHVILELMGMYCNKECRIIAIRPEYTRDVDEGEPDADGYKTYAPARLITMTVDIDYYTNNAQEV